MGWQPSGNGINGITDQNFTNYQTNSVSLMRANGAVAYLAPKNDFPFNGNNNGPLTELLFMDWGLQALGGSPTFSAQKLDKTFYNNANDDEAKDKVAWWNTIVNSLDSSSETWRAQEYIRNTYPEMYDRQGILAHNQGLAILIENDIPISGIMSLYNITQNKGSVTISGQRVSLSEISSAYQDAWSDALAYLSSKEKVGSQENWLRKYNLSLPFRPWHVIGRGTKEFHTKVVDGLRTPADLLSMKCGFRRTNTSLVWDEATALSAVDTDWLAPNLTNANNNQLWYKYGLTEGDNITGVTITSEDIRAWHKTSRQWGLATRQGTGYMEGYGATISNGSQTNEMPETNCIAIVPSFSVFPELYQCLVKKGPAWDWASANRSRTPSEQSRLWLRSYVFQYPLYELNASRFFNQTYEGKKVGIPGSMLPAQAIQLAGIMMGQISAIDFKRFGAYGAGQVQLPYDGSYPTHHFRLYNPMDISHGFAHSIAVRSLWTNIDIGSSIPPASSTSITEVQGNQVINENMMLYNLIFFGWVPGLKNLSAALYHNPAYIVETGKTALFHIADSGISSNRNTTSNKIQAKSRQWTGHGSKGTDNGVGVWALNPSFTSSGSNHIVKTGSLKINFKAWTENTQNAKVFLEFRFYAVDITKFNETQITNVIKDIGGEDGAISVFDSSRLSDYEMMFTLPGKSYLDNQGSGRKLHWKPFDAGTFEGFRSQSSILSPVLSGDITEYSLNLYLSDFPTQAEVENTPYPDRISDDSGQLEEGRVFEADGLFFFVSVRAHHLSNFGMTKDYTDVYLSTEDFRVELPTSSTQSGYLGGIQKYKNTFPPDTTHANVMSEFNLCIPNKIKNSLLGEFTAYENSVSSTFIDSTNYLNFAPRADTSGIPFVYPRAIVAGNNLADASQETILALLKSYAGISIVTPNNLMDYSFMSGDPEHKWILQIDISRIVSETLATIQGDIYILSRVNYRGVDGSNLPISGDVVTKATAGGAINIDVSPIISDMTFLQGGWFVIQLNFVVATSGSSGAGFIECRVASTKLSHQETISKLDLAPIDPTRKGSQHIGWYRGLPAYGDLYTSTDYIAVMEKTSQNMMVAGGEGTYQALFISPPIRVPMQFYQGWVLDYLGVDIEDVRVALQSGEGLLSPSESVASTGSDVNSIKVMTVNTTKGTLTVYDFPILTDIVNSPKDWQPANDTLNYASITDWDIAASSSINDGSKSIHPSYFMATVDTKTDSEGHPLMKFTMVYDEKVAYQPQR